jgi:hypothetical protein
MQDHPDDAREKRDQERPKADREREEQEAKYNSYLRRAQEDRLKDMADLKFVYQSGTDATGRPIIVFIASHIPATVVDMVPFCSPYLLFSLCPSLFFIFDIVSIHARLVLF